VFKTPLAVKEGEIRMLKLAIAVSAVFLATASGTAQNLPPEIRSRLFAPPPEITLAQRFVAIPMNGTDRNGFYKCPYIQAYVNGHGPFTFLFDTGSSYTSVSTRLVEEARPELVFDRKGSRDVFNLRDIRIGDVKLRDVYAIHQDGFNVDGVIGFRIFGDNNMLFDFNRRVLTISRTEIPLHGSFELPYDTEFNVPTIPVRIGSRTMPILIDTGDDAYGLEIRHAELDDARTSHPPIPATAVLNGQNSQTVFVTSLLDSVAIGPVESDGPVIGINDDIPVGDLGFEALRQFQIEFVPSKRVVLFRPLFRRGKFTLSGNRNPGFQFSFSTGIVRTVVPNSAAASAGLRIGIELVEIDGKSPLSFTPRTWDKRVASGRPVMLRWRDESGMHDVTLAIEEMH